MQVKIVQEQTQTTTLHKYFWELMPQKTCINQLLNHQIDEKVFYKKKGLISCALRSRTLSSSRGLGAFEDRNELRVISNKSLVICRNRVTRPTTVPRLEYEILLHNNEHYLSNSENKAWKNSGLYGIWTHDLCDTGAVPYQQS